MQVEEDLKYMNDYIEDTENVHNKLVDLKHRSRRNNMKIKKGWEERLSRERLFANSYDSNINKIF